jgi:hypothetical protein
MLTKQERAEAYRLGLIVGLFEGGEVVTWADEVIASEAKPENVFLDISMGDCENTAQLTSLLKDAAGDPRPGKARDVVFGMLAKQLGSDAGAAESVAAKLKALRSAYDPPDAQMTKAAELAAAVLRDAADEEGLRALTAFLTPYSAAADEWT